MRITPALFVGSDTMGPSTVLRREIVKRARVDQIDADNAKQARYQAALAEVREEIYGKETA